MGVKSIAVLGASLVLIPAAPASAGTLTTQNSCKWSYDSIWRHLGVDLSGVASPSPVAPGSGVRLTQAAVRAVLPEYLAEIGYNSQILDEGVNEIPAKVWLAVAAPGTPQGTQTFALETVARTTITAPGGDYQSSTPIDVTIPVPDSTWTAPTSAIGFRQAGAGALGRIPAGTNGAQVTALGSAYISASVGSVRMNIDCQPANGEGADPPAPATAGAFETVQIDPGAPVVFPAPPAPTAKKPALTLRTSKLKRAGKRVSVALVCADAPCKGTVSAKYAGGTAAKSVKYTLAAGARKTYKLTLSAKALKSLKKKSLLVRVKVTTDGGTTVSKKLRLKK
jgi:hypothetical protein